MVEVFKTNVSDSNYASQMLEILNYCFPSYSINFDLQDCDNILRVEAAEVNHEGVIEIFRKNNSMCERLN